jgi:hypothetical protein
MIPIEFGGKNSHETDTVLFSPGFRLVALVLTLALGRKSVVESWRFEDRKGDAGREGVFVMWFRDSGLGLVLSWPSFTVT